MPAGCEAQTAASASAFRLFSPVELLYSCTHFSFLNFVRSRSSMRLSTVGGQFLPCFIEKRIHILPKHRVMPAQLQCWEFAGPDLQLDEPRCDPHVLGRFFDPIASRFRSTFRSRRHGQTFLVHHSPRNFLQSFLATGMDRRVTGRLYYSTSRIFTHGSREFYWPRGKYRDNAPK